MPLPTATAITCVNFCIGVSALFSASGWGLVEIRRALGCLQDAESLSRTVAALGLSTTAKQLQGIAQKAVTDLERSPEFAGSAHDCQSHFEQVIHLCDFDAGAMVTARTNADRIV